MSKPEYVYVASSWRNPFQEAVCTTLTAAGIEHYDFKNPPGGTGFSWREVKPHDLQSSTLCANCGREIVLSTYRAMGGWEPDYDPADDPMVWRHKPDGYGACNFGGDNKFAVPAVKLKNTDWEPVSEYLAMIAHERAIEGFTSDFDAMKRADTFVMILPCGKSAHLELGWAAGAGKRTAILLEDPVEPELMYKMCDHLAPSLLDLLSWLGVKD
jgi:hypothetical protein